MGHGQEEVLGRPGDHRVGQHGQPCSVCWTDVRTIHQAHPCPELTPVEHAVLPVNSPEFRGQRVAAQQILQGRVPELIHRPGLTQDLAVQGVA